MRKRFLFLPLFFAAIGFATFERTPGADAVRAVQILTLIATGMCLGVALAHLFITLGWQSRNQPKEPQS